MPALGQVVKHASASGAIAKRSQPDRNGLDRLADGINHVAIVVRIGVERTWAKTSLRVRTMHRLQADGMVGAAIDFKKNATQH
jgi:hypothetical protein